MIASRFMNITGLDDLSNFNMNVDGSTTPVEFLLKPTATEIFQIKRILPYLRDGGSFDSGGYGNGSALINGIEIFVRSKGADGLQNVIKWDMTKQKKIKVNTDWASYSYDLVVSNFGSGDEALGARYSFDKEASEGIVLDGANGEELVVRISDSLTNLVEHLIHVGFSIKKA